MCSQGVCFKIYFPNICFWLSKHRRKLHNASAGFFFLAKALLFIVSFILQAVPKKEPPHLHIYKME